MAYDLILRRQTKANLSRGSAVDAIGADLHLSAEDRMALVATGEKVKSAGLFILGGLLVVAIAEIVGHRNMSFRGDGFFHKYKEGRGL